MAKRKGRRRKGYVFTAARRRALKKAQRARHRKHGGHKRKHGGHKRKHGGRKRKHGGRKRKHGGGKQKRRAGLHPFGGRAVGARARFNALVQRLEEKGHDRKTAEGLARRAQKIHANMRRGVEKAKAEARRRSENLANMFAGFGAAAHMHRGMV